ncbi:MAG: MFS transporter [Micrococcales bacterium 73-13]|nr:MAG: MFS transporter [Micrococcales bacterium 73-13]
MPAPLPRLNGRVSGVGLRSERGPILLAMMLSMGLIAIDSTVLATAVPSIVADIGGFESFPWLFSIYLLAMSVLVPVYSKLADTIGRKPVLLFGIAVFLIGSILCGFAWDMPSLIVFRAVQGIGAGAIQPLSLTVVGDIYTLEERARVQGYMASVWAIASIAGPVLGAVFSELHAWRWVFYINIPLCLLAGWLVLRGLKERLERRQHRIDYAGAVLVTLGLGSIILATLEGGHAWAWDSWTSIALYGGGALLLVAFVLVERRAAEPVLAPGLLRRPVISVSVGLGLVLGIALIGLTEYIPTYLQVGAGTSALVGGAALAAMLIGWPIASTIAGRVYLSRGFRFTIVSGGALALVGGVALVLTASWPSPWIVAACSFVIGFGLGWASVPALVAAQLTVPWQERGVATGTIMFSRNLGQALGAAILGAVANGVIAGRGGDSSDPATIVAASMVVFIAVAGVLGAQFLLAFLMPSDRALQAASVEAGGEEIRAEAAETQTVAVEESLLGIDVEDCGKRD